MKWLNGKKTIIGALLWLLTAAFVLATGQHVDGFAAPSTWMEFASIAAATLASAFSGTGLFHKFIKWAADNANDKVGVE